MKNLVFRCENVGKSDNHAVIWRDSFLLSYQIFKKTVLKAYALLRIACCVLGADVL